MASQRVTRPVVRSFTQRFVREAAAHVRAGGHAIVWTSAASGASGASGKRATLVFSEPEPGDDMDLGVWSLLDMGKQRWNLEKRGPLRGLATASVPRDCLELVGDRIERDSVHPGATRTMYLDCEACAACCRKNHVELERADIRRFRDAGREELLRPPFTRRDGNKLVLRLLRSGDCRHLRVDLRCSIYAIRPEACRTFPPGSEGCLFSREEELGVVDGPMDPEV
jgi:Fe-S-cluster containining protein